MSALRFLWHFWSTIVIAVVSVALWPFVAIARRAKREHWSDPR